MGDKMNPFLQPDYTKPISQVFANATLHLMTQSCSLNSICSWQRTDRLSELPSWVPDYSLDQSRAATPLVSIDGTENMFSASGYNIKTNVPSADVATSTKYDWRQLCTTGLFLDSVTLLSETASPNLSFTDSEKIWLSTISSANNFLPTIDKDVKSTLNTVSEVVRNFNIFWDAIDNKPQTEKSAAHELQDSKLTLVPSTSSHPGATAIYNKIARDKQRNTVLFGQRSYVVDAYIHSLLCGKISAHKRLTKEKIDSILSFDFRTQLGDMSPQEIQEVKEICGPFVDGMRRRRLAITKKGYIGALPEDTNNGDVVCVLFGCSVPVVLRKQEEVEHGYKFVGECYLHGFMDAEAIVMHKKGQLKAEDITLC